MITLCLAVGEEKARICIGNSLDLMDPCYALGEDSPV